MLILALHQIKQVESYQKLIRFLHRPIKYDARGEVILMCTKIIYIHASGFCLLCLHYLFRKLVSSHVAEGRGINVLQLYIEYFTSPDCR